MVLCFSCAYTQTTFGTIEQNTCCAMVLLNIKIMLGQRVYLDYGFGSQGFGTYVYCAKTHKVLMFFKDEN
jgi:hypothetical protein